MTGGIICGYWTVRSEDEATKIFEECRVFRRSGGSSVQHHDEVKKQEMLFLSFTIFTLQTHQTVSSISLSHFITKQPP